MRRIAVIDIGTQSILFLLGQEEQGRLYRLTESSANIRLGSLDANQHIREERLETCAEFLLKFADEAESAGADHILAVGTAVFRNASNGREAARRLSERTAIPVEILSESEEARLSFMGALWKRNVRGKSWVIDAGGGSTECILGQERKMIQWNSLPLGAVSMDQLLSGDPPDTETVTEMQSRIRDVLSGFRALAAEKTDRVIGVGGTLTTLAAMELGNDEYHPDQVDGLRLTRSDLNKWMNFFRANPVDKRSRIPGLLSERADIIMAGTAIFCQILDLTGHHQITVSDRGLRHGVLIREAEKQL